MVTSSSSLDTELLDAVEDSLDNGSPMLSPPGLGMVASNQVSGFSSIAGVRFFIKLAIFLNY
jgi:hypothetical protein